MRRPLLPLLAVLLLLTLALPALAETTRGDVELQRGDFGPPDGAPEIKLGQTVTLEGSVYLTDFFDSDVVNAAATVTNAGDKPMFFAYHVAIFDAEGNLLGAASMTSFGDEGLAAGEQAQLGSLMMTLPAEAIGRVASYQATFYESDEPM